MCCTSTGIRGKVSSFLSSPNVKLDAMSCRSRSIGMDARLGQVSSLLLFNNTLQMRQLALNTLNKLEQQQNIRFVR